MRIAVGSDHGGFYLKKRIVSFLRKGKHRVMDVGAFDDSPSDYPDFAKAVAEKIKAGTAARGILVCGSGVGACIAANKVRGIRASVCHDTFSARQGVEDDDMNLLCLGSRVIGPMLAEDIIKAFLSAQFSGKARHVKRLKKVLAMEKSLPR